jgi:carbonic anhydrase/acetyltransferase-like protein (isoleucine patch superfamily)
MSIFAFMSKYATELVAKVTKGENVFIAPNATVMGDVILSDYVSVWYGAVIRADTDTISVGEGTNIQDGVICHTDPGLKLSIGRNCTIGHGAVLHGCTVGDHSLIGIRATVLNGARIGSGCIVAAHALVTEDMVVPDHSMVMGVPGKVVRTLTANEIERLKAGAAHYLHESMKYSEQ